MEVERIWRECICDVHNVSSKLLRYFGIVAYPATLLLDRLTSRTEPPQEKKNQKKKKNRANHVTHDIYRRFTEHLIEW